MSGYWNEFGEFTPAETVASSWTPPPISTSAAGSTPASTGTSFTPTSTQSFQDAILNSPYYKQSMENIAANAAKNLERENAMWGLTQASYAIPVGGGGGGDYGLAAAEASAKLQREKAEHDLANQQEYAREALGSRGLASSGQNEVDQGELRYQYDMLMKQIDVDLQGRRSAAASAASAAASAASAASQQRALQLQEATLKHQWAIQDLTSAQADASGQLLISIMDKATWDPVNNVYVLPGGTIIPVGAIG